MLQGYCNVHYPDLRFFRLSTTWETKNRVVHNDGIVISDCLKIGVRVFKSVLDKGYTSDRVSISEYLYIFMNIV